MPHRVWGASSMPSQIETLAMREKRRNFGPSHQGID